VYAHFDLTLSGIASGPQSAYRASFRSLRYYSQSFRIDSLNHSYTLFRIFASHSEYGKRANVPHDRNDSVRGKSVAPGDRKGEPIEDTDVRPLTNNARREVLLSCEGQALAYLRKHFDNLCIYGEYRIIKIIGFNENFFEDRVSHRGAK
jgi:hypothetical protein